MFFIGSMNISRDFIADQKNNYSNKQICGPSV